MLTAFNDCPYRIYYKGHKDPDFKIYFPGESPGYYCKELDCICNESDILDYSQCPRLDPILGKKCPICLQPTLFLDTEDKTTIYCKCGEEFCINDISEERFLKNIDINVSTTSTATVLEIKDNQTGTIYRFCLDPNESISVGEKLIDMWAQVLQKK